MLRNIWASRRLAVTGRPESPAAIKRNERRKAMARLTHVDRGGRTRMVDVGQKPETTRRAVARALVKLPEEVFRLVRQNAIAKGDVLTVAQIAGIQTGKKASEWIPLCHPIPLDKIDVRLSLDEPRHCVTIEAEAATRAATGVEMEAMVAAAAAALTVYDMCKGTDRSITVEEIGLVSKSGGKSGTWKRSGEEAAQQPDDKPPQPMSREPRGATARKMAGKKTRRPARQPR